MEYTALTYDRARNIGKIIEAVYPSDNTRWKISYLGATLDDESVHLTGFEPIRIADELGRGTDVRGHILTLVGSLGLTHRIAIDDLLDAAADSRVQLVPQEVTT